MAAAKTPAQDLAEVAYLTRALKAPTCASPFPAAIPAEARGTAPRAAVELVDELTDRAIASEFEQVQGISSPEWPALLDYAR